jgi:hypothetical protein
MYGGIHVPAWRIVSVPEIRGFPVWATTHQLNYRQAAGGTLILYFTFLKLFF